MSSLAKVHNFGTLLQWDFCLLICVLVGSGEVNGSVSILLKWVSQVLEIKSQDYFLTQNSWAW